MVAIYSFKEIIKFFSEKLEVSPPEEDLKEEEVELIIDNFHVNLSKGQFEGSLHICLILGLLVYPIREERMKELATSNYLGINTGGCKLSMDELGITLNLHAHTTCATSPQENWEWFHRVLCIGREWNKVLALWEEFVPLTTTEREYE